MQEWGGGSVCFVGSVFVVWIGFLWGFLHWSLRGCADISVNCQIRVISEMPSQLLNDEYRNFDCIFVYARLDVGFFCELPASGICGRRQAGQYPGIERAYIFLGARYA